MRRLVFAAMLVVALAAAAVPASGKEGEGEKLPGRSGFFDFFDVSSEFGFGLGRISDLSCTVSTSTQPAVYAGNHLVDCDAEVPHNETAIAVDPTNASHAVGGYHSYQIVRTGGTVHTTIEGVVSVTTDGGTTWQEVAPPLTPYQFSGDPALAFTSTGRLYFANIADHEGENGFPFTGPSVVVATSTDGGLTWTNPVTVAKGKGVAGSQGQLVFQDKEFIAVDASVPSPYTDRAYVSWSSFQIFKSFIRIPIMLSRSDNGQTWSEGIEISGFSPACSAALFGAPNECDLNQFSSPSTAPNGTVYVGFENFNTPAENQYLVVKSTNGGASFANPVRVGTIFDINYPTNVDDRATLTGCQFRVASPGNIAADPSDPTGNTLYAVWADNRNGSAAATNNDVFLFRSTNGGATWTQYTVDATANDQFYPWVAVSSTGRVDVGYMDRSYSAGQSVCQYGFSLTRITSFSPLTKTKTRVDTGLSDPGKSRWFSATTAGNSRFIGDYNGIAIGSNGKTWSLWTDQRADASNAIPPNRIKGQHAVAGITNP